MKKIEENTICNRKNSIRGSEMEIRQENKRKETREDIISAKKEAGKVGEELKRA